jgi:amino acid transporter
MLERRRGNPPTATCAMLLVFLSIFACALANVRTLSRMVWAMARDAQLPASTWLSRISHRNVPANTIRTVAAIAAILLAEPTRRLSLPVFVR